MSQWKEKAKKLKTEIPAIFLALKDKRTPWDSKIIAAVIVMYALSPIDFIPDFIPFLGYLDDVVILPILIAWCIKSIPSQVLADCRTRSEGMWEEGKSKKWYFAIPFVLIWLILIALIVLAFLG